MKSEVEYLGQRLINERDRADIVICTIEEMSEVTKVLTKYLRKSGKFNMDDLTEELAHAFLMLDIVKRLFGVDDGQILSEQLAALKKAFKE